MKRVLSSFALLFLFACGDPPPSPGMPDSGADPDGGAETGQKQQPSCPKRWGTILRGVPQLSSIEVKDGDLFIESDGKAALLDCFECGNKAQLFVYQNDFTGDFKAGIDVAGLVAEGKGQREIYGYVGHSGHDTKARLRLTLAEDGLSIAKIAVIDQKGEEVAKDLPEPFPKNAALEVSRKGADVTIKIVAGAENVEKTFASSDEQLRVGVGIKAGLDAPLTVRISKFDLTGGGDKVAADAFECDSVIY